MNNLVLVGKKILHWEVIREDPETIAFPVSYKRYICRCDCGLLKSFKGRDLAQSKLSRCRNCFYKERVKHDIQPGAIFNQWTVIEEQGVSKVRRFTCRCSCGTIATRCLVSLVYSQSKCCFRCTQRKRIALKIIKAKEQLKLLQDHLKTLE